MPSLRSRSSAIAALSLFVLLASCATTEGPSFYDGPFAYTEVHLTPSIVRPGMTAQAHLLAFTEEGTLLGEVATTWTGDGPEHAVVDPDGTVHGVAPGQVTLSTAADPNPFLWSLYVTPPDSCGLVTEVSDWWLQGSFAWHDTASVGDSSITTHHTGSWSLIAREPRQVNSGEIAWRFSAPRSGETFTVEVNDTFRVGAMAWVERGHVTRARPREFSGTVVLDLAACQLYTRVYPTSVDSTFRVVPGFADSLVTGDALGYRPFGTPRVGVAGIVSSAPVTLADTLPLLPPTDSDVSVGYAPSGYAALVNLWRPLAAPVAVAFTGTPDWQVVALARHR